MPNNPVKVNKKKREDFLTDLSSFMQSKGFIWGPFPEIYGGGGRILYLWSNGEAFER